MDKRRDERREGQLDERRDGWTNGEMNGGREGQMDERRDGWTNGGTNGGREGEIKPMSALTIWHPNHPYTYKKQV